MTTTRTTNTNTGINNGELRGLPRGTERADGRSERKLVEVHRWNDFSVGSYRCTYAGMGSYRWEATHRAQPQHGEFLGYAVISTGDHNARLRGPIRDSVEAAARDLCNPELAFEITGYICG